jgi:small-conductance mechanosensitive channel
VRSTEIETFDRSSVIVPNSELITRAVTNWTHRNSIGRIVIKIGVSYDADPKRVCEILERIGKAHPGVLQYPAPLATFDNFGASSLDFSLNVFVSNIAQPANVRTDLRTSILNEFRAAGIEIPYPQQDIHLRDLDPLRESLLRAIAERKLQEALQEGVPPTPFTPAKRA